MDDRTIRRGYRQVLGRDPDPEGLADFRTCELTEEQLLIRLSNSLEALGRSGDDQLTDSVGPYLRWPHLWHLCLPQHRILYAPIPKNGSTRLKRLIAALSDSPMRVELLAGDTNEIIDRRFTGLSVRDRSHREIVDAFQGDGYLRFAVVRDPFDRLLSAYWEKFVVNRRARGNLQHTAPVTTAIAEAVGRRQRVALWSDGPTFRQFVEYLDRTPTSGLDPHWRPQSDFLAGVDWNLLVDMTAIGRLEQLLVERCGTAPVSHEDRSNVTDAGRDLDFRESAADLRPRNLVRHGRPSKQSFLEPEVESMIAEAYAEDSRLFSARQRL